MTLESTHVHVRNAALVVTVERKRRKKKNERPHSTVVVTVNLSQCRRPRYPRYPLLHPIGPSVSVNHISRVVIDTQDGYALLVLPTLTEFII